MIPKRVNSGLPTKWKWKKERNRIEKERKKKERERGKKVTLPLKVIRFVLFHYIFYY